MKNKSCQSGYTLMEALMFIALISMVAMTIISVTSKMLDRYRISRATSQVTEIQRSIANRFASAPSYAKLTTTLIKKEKLLPADVYWKGNTAYHKLGGTIVISNKYAGNVSGTGSYSHYVNDSGSGNTHKLAEDQNNVFTITFKGLSKKACMELAVINWDAIEYSRLITLKINTGKTFFYSNYGNKYNILPVTMAKAKSECNKAKDNYIRWAFL